MNWMRMISSTKRIKSALLRDSVVIVSIVASAPAYQESCQATKELPRLCSSRVKAATDATSVANFIARTKHYRK